MSFRLDTEVLEVEMEESQKVTFRFLDRTCPERSRRARYDNLKI